MNQASGLRRFGFVVAAASAALLVVEACADGVGEMLVDAGTMLADAGSDGGLLTEAGQMFIEAGMNMRDAQTDVGAQAAANFKSGSRIQMRSALHAGTDGSQVATLPAPFDTMLNVGCVVQLASDGKLRCIPAWPNAAQLVSGNFADAQCTQRVAAHPCSDLTPTYATETFGSPSCASGNWHQSTKVFRLGAEYTGTIYNRGSASSPCAATVPASGWRAFVVGAEVPATSFVEFTSAGNATL